MRAIQRKHPSEREYRTLTLIDTTEVNCRHYAVAVDIYDKRTTKILKSLLNVLGGKDQITLIAFGLHPEQIHFNIQDYVDNDNVVCNLLARSECGLNTLVGVRMLEKITADDYIMITAGYHDRAPRNIKSHLNISVLVPGTTSYLNTHNITCFPENGPYERIIRETFEIPDPNYFGIVLDSTNGIYLSRPPSGGSRTFQLTGDCHGLTITYMLKDGKVEQVDCELEDDETIPYKSSYMRPCDMVE